MEPLLPTPSVVRAEEGAFVELGDHRAWIKVSSRDSAGSLLVFEMEADANGGVPPHVHGREDETFYILSGRFGFLIGDQSIEAGAGDCVFAPRDIPHAWRCLGPEPGRALVQITPGANFEAFAGAMAQMHATPAVAVSDPALAARFCALATAHGIQMLPALK